jgi:hypothetical protein
MFITISKTQGDRYVFSVGDDPRADKGSWVKSDTDAAILGDIPSSFRTFGEAHAFASRLADDHPSCVLAKKVSFYRQGDQELSAESQTISNYTDQVDLIHQRLFDIQNLKGQDAVAEIMVVKKELDGIRQEIDKIMPLVESEVGKKKISEIIDKIESSLQIISKMEAFKKASAMSFSSHLPKIAIRVFAEAAMTGIQPRYADVFIKSASLTPLSGGYEVVLASLSEGNLVKLTFDHNLLLSDIVPYGASLNKCGGRMSKDFLLGYWEPIVNAVGHFYSKGNNIVALASPPRLRRFIFPGFSITDNSKTAMIVDDTKVLGEKSWLIKKAALVTPPVSTPIAIGSEVVCINSKLPTYAGRTGAVTEAADKSDHYEYRIDFRRGIGIVWLEDKDIRQVEIGV